MNVSLEIGVLKELIRQGLISEEEFKKCLSVLRKKEQENNETGSSVL